MSFAAPELVWTVLAAPLLAAAVVWIWRRRAAAEAAWVARGLWPRLRASGAPRTLIVVALVPALAAAAIAAGLARPRWGASVEKVERQGVDIVFVLDTSQSMAAADVTPSRFWVAQSLVRRIVAELPGHRVALVQDEGTGIVLAPLTTDAAVLDLLLDGLETSSAPLPGTRVVPGLERALGLFPEGGRKHRVIVVLSDGEIHLEQLAGIVRRLKEEGAVVHGFAIGTVKGAPVPEAHAAGEYKKDRAGKPVISRLHRETLEQLADATGGTVVTVEGAAASPQPILDRIRGMEKKEIDEQLVSTLEERFQWPLGAAAALLALALWLTPFAPRAAEPGS